MRVQAKKILAPVNLAQPNNIKIVTMKELGPRLPLGMVDQTTGELSKSIATRRWTLRTEKALGKMRDENKRENPVRFISMVVASLCEQIGSLKVDDPQELTKSKAGKNEWNTAVNVVSQMWYGDVLYVWLWLRRTCLGPDIEMDLTCPRCKAKNSIEGDLDTIEVRTADAIEDTYWEYELAHPFNVRGHNVRKLEIGPIRWSVIERAAKSGDLDTGDTKSAVIWSSIRSIEGLENIALTEEELEDMHKLDLEALTAEVDKRSIGPDMAIEVECHKCKNDFRTSLDWSYDGFFGVSGQSATRKT